MRTKITNLPARGVFLIWLLDASSSSRSTPYHCICDTTMHFPGEDIPVSPAVCSSLELSRVTSSHSGASSSSLKALAATFIQSTAANMAKAKRLKSTSLFGGNRLAQHWDNPTTYLDRISGASPHHHGQTHVKQTHKTNL